MYKRLSVYFKNVTDIKEQRITMIPINHLVAKLAIFNPIPNLGLFS